jgi:hypothetical protein
LNLIAPLHGRYLPFATSPPSRVAVRCRRVAQSFQRRAFPHARSRIQEGTSHSPLIWRQRGLPDAEKNVVAAKVVPSDVAKRKRQADRCEHFATFPTWWDDSDLNCYTLGSHPGTAEPMKPGGGRGMSQNDGLLTSRGSDGPLAATLPSSSASLRDTPPAIRDGTRTFVAKRARLATSRAKGGRRVPRRSFRTMARQRRGRAGARRTFSTRLALSPCSVRACCSTSALLDKNRGRALAF